MQYKEFLRIERIKKYLNIAAYASLLLDVAIAAVTLASLHVYSQQVNQIQFFLNVALTVEVMITLLLFFILVALYHYEKILDKLASVSRAITRNDVKKRSRR